ncbi:MAG: EAL domain-containing protein (putative c-di-GMP-specific phosphodiesterase class I) [Oceanicoccus sp.]|jgi:EAL domain-containing protein (putative c-di-GMP-specific phosphodiesterase class I)/GGDEF domain-containing protein
MSIRRQLALYIGLLMVVILSGNLLLNIINLKTHFEQQLQARADETATTLALTLSQSAQTQDNASLRSMIDVIFDRGHFSLVRFTYTDSQDVIERGGSEKINVPTWFKSAMRLTPSFANTEVISGWNQLGQLSVAMHQGPSYEQLWRLVKAECAWFLLMTFIVVYGMRVLLIWLLKPLKQIESLAQKLSHNQFVHIHEKPTSRELHSLVQAMNHLSDRLHASFLAHGQTVRKLQHETFNDGLTQVLNNKGWDQYLYDWMKHEQFAPGWIALLHVDNLKALNEGHGKAIVDELLVQISMQLKTESSLNHEHVGIARTGGGDFWLFSPDPLDKQYTVRIEAIHDSLKRLSLVQQYKAQLFFVAMPLHEPQSPASLKHQLDLLLQRSKNQQQSLLVGATEYHPLTNWVEWQQRLKNALIDESIQLYSQPLFDETQSIIQQEIHCRLVEDDGEEPLMAGYFWPMVDKLNLSQEFDRLVIRMWQRLFESQKDSHAFNGKWVLNIAGKSLNEPSFRQWFTEHLSQDQLNSLVIECSEYTLAHVTVKTQTWLHEMSEQGLRLSVDHVGTSGKSFGFLARFPVYQGKIERRYIRDIHAHKDNAFFVSGMIQVFQAQSALCFAEGVEKQEEIDALMKLGVDGVMGYAVGRPTLLEIPAAKTDPAHAPDDEL